MRNRPGSVSSGPMRASMIVPGVLLAVNAAAQTSWQVGQPLPHVHLPTIDGKEEMDLSSFRGKKLLLVEFASW